MFLPNFCLCHGGLVGYWGWGLGIEFGGLGCYFGGELECKMGKLCYLHPLFHYIHVLFVIDYQTMILVQAVRTSRLAASLS